MKILLGMAGKYHIIGSYGGHRWHGFGLKDLDAQAAFPLSTEFRLARLFKQTQTVNRYSKNSYKKHA